MTAPEPTTVKRALGAHAAIGLVACALLYLVCLTGSLAVFYQELQRIEQPTAPEIEGISPAAVQRGVEAVLAREAAGPPTTHLYVHMPVADLPRATVTTDTRALHLDAEGNIAGPEEISWSDFLVELHYTLNLPALIGITIVGGLGAMMLALSLTGVIAHPRIFRDAFRLRARDKGGVAVADWHNRLSVWTLPFNLVIALTGAVIGMATITAYALAGTSYGGDVEAVYSPIFGEERAVDGTPAPPANVAGALAQMAARYPGVKVTYAVLHDPGTAGQHVQIVGRHERRLIFGEYYDFEADGTFHGTAGLSDGAMGQQAAASIYSLHFGDFAGLPVKIAYALLGLALTAICATGTYIWLGKCERRGNAAPHLRQAWTSTIWAVPAALIATFALRLIGGNSMHLEAAFWLMFTAAILVPQLRLRLKAGRSASMALQA